MFKKSVTGAARRHRALRLPRLASMLLPWPSMALLALLPVSALAEEIGAAADAAGMPTVFCER